MTSAPAERGSADETRDTQRRGESRRAVGAARSEQVGRHRRFRVLVADDDARSLDCLVALLDREGFSIDLANCGFEALARFGLSNAGVSVEVPAPREEVVTPYDFIVLDYNMPDVTGIEVLRRIRVRFGGALPAIMVSGDYSRELQKSWSAVGGFALLPKPVEPDDFRNQVRQLVQRFFG